jgi:hypothetical protein
VDTVAPPVQTATPDPAPEGGPPDPSPEPTPTLEPLEGPRPEGVDDIAEQVSALRGLPISEPLDVRSVARSDLGARFAELARAEMDPEEVAADERLLVALRLLEPEVDLLAVLEAFYSEQVLGMYSTDERILYVGADSATLSPAQEITAAHEITHALQDQRFGLRDLLELDHGQSDRQLAALSLVEGDAVLVQELWSARHQSSEERDAARLEAFAGGGDAFRDAPRYVRDAVLFPYSAGARFVQTLVEDGGFEAVDAAFEQPPRSTAEIMHPERYLAGWTPEEVTVTAAPGGRWSEAATYELGAFDLNQLFLALGQERGQAIAAGWSGGAVRHWQDDAGDAVALTLRFEDAEAAADACAATPAWYAHSADGTAAGGQTMQSDRDWLAWSCADLEVRLGLAPDEATATTLTR